MKILYATSEAVPFCKTGGLADVAGSLPPALAACGAQVAVVLPLYQAVKEKYAEQLEFVCYDYVDLAWRHCYCGLFRMEYQGVIWYFLDNEQYFMRQGFYGHYDDCERFGFFSRAIVRMLQHMEFWPDVIHCNDWQTALVPIYLKDDGVREDRFRSIKTVLSVHNIEYQGRYGKQVLGDVLGLDPGWAADGTILMDGDVNLLKGAILCADAVNAVSPTYAEELKYAYYAHGMESVMQLCSYKLSGVLNGIDTARYDPAADQMITANYSAADVSGKEADKAHLRQIMGLRDEPNVPIIGMVSRLVAHKGLDLVCDVVKDIMEMPVQLVVLGKGDQRYEDFFRWAASAYPGRVGVRLDYNEELSMAIYAGADLFLMPSKSEPCGLSQMIAMRYGTVPIVRETGGLKDTVHAYESWRDAGNGFTFASYNSGDMLYVIRQAVGLYRDYKDAFARLRMRGMEEDFSWNRSAAQYLRIYEAITGIPVPAPEAPAEEAPMQEAPAEEAPTEEAPAEEAPAEEAPAEETPVQEPPVEEASAEEAPAEEAPTEETPVEETAAEEAPMEESPVEETPMEETPVQEPPVEEAPMQEDPAEEAPTEETPVEEDPAEEAPVEEAPAEEAPAPQAEKPAAGKPKKKGSAKGRAKKGAGKRKA